MPDMRIQKSGGIIFHRTPQERENLNKKRKFQNDVEEIGILKEELKNKLEEVNKLLKKL